MHKTDSFNLKDSKVPLGMLLSMIHRSRMIYLNDRMKHIGLTAGQCPFIMFLSEEEGITQEELAAHFHIDKGTVARAVKKLEEKNYLFRQVDMNNRRRYQIYLTNKGKRAVPQIINIDKEWEDSVCCKYSQEEYGQLENILKILAIKSLEKLDRKDRNNGN